MAWIVPVVQVTGDFITAVIWNQNVVSNPIAINAGAIALTSQAAEDVVVASSATQLKRYTPAKSFMQNWFAWTNTR